MSFLEIKYRWLDVQSSQGYPYRFPEKVTDFMKEMLGRPTVYQWTVRTPTAHLRALYVGETENLARRIGHCLCPGARQVTNLRLKAYFGEAVSRGERVELQCFDFDPFEINKVTFSMDLLGHTHLRRMLENLILVWLHSSTSAGSPVILNQVLAQDVERSKRRVDDTVSALKKLGLSEDAIQQVISKSVVRKTRI